MLASGIPQRPPNCTFQVQTSPQSSRPSYLSACLLSSSAVSAQSLAHTSDAEFIISTPTLPITNMVPNGPAPRWMAPAAQVTALVWSLASASPPPVSTRQRLLPVSPPKHLLNQPTSRYCHAPPVVSESLTCHLIGLPASTVASQADLFPNKWPFPSSLGIPVLCCTSSMQCLLSLQRMYLIHSSVWWFD